MNDLRFAWRTFRKAPGPTLLAVIAIALGIGANTAIFSVVRAVLLKPLPYASPDRLVALFESNATTGTARVDTALANYETWRDHTRSFENVAASAYWVPALTSEGDAEQLLAGHVSELLQYSGRSSGDRPRFHGSRGSAGQEQCDHPQPPILDAAGSGGIRRSLAEKWFWIKCPTLS